MGSRSFFLRFGIVLTLWALTPGVEGVSVTTTIYVGRHFEIRDHDQPTKYVFAGQTRVAEVIGSLSNNVRVQRLRLYPGWNLVSLAVTVQDLAGQLGANQPGVVRAAYQWNPSSGEYSSLAPGQTVSAGTVLWIKAATSASFAGVGVYTDPVNPHIQAGGGYVACTGLEAWVPGLVGTFSAWAYSPDPSCWQVDFLGNLGLDASTPLTIAPGEAFYIQTDSPVDLVIPDSALRIRYYHQDHLGSSSVITDVSGAMIEENSFFPFGSPHSSSEPRDIHDPYQFTQKERDRESGLHYFEARCLTSWIGRFASTDPRNLTLDKLDAEDFGAFLANPQKHNPYAYVLNNPLKYEDPTGLDNFCYEPESEEGRSTISKVIDSKASAGEETYEGLAGLACGGAEMDAAQWTAGFVRHAYKGASTARVIFNTVTAPVWVPVVVFGSATASLVVDAVHVGKGGVRLAVKGVTKVYHGAHDLVFGEDVPESVANIDLEDYEETSTKTSGVAYESASPPPRPTPKPVRQQTIHRPVPPQHYYSRPIVETKSPVTSDDFGYENAHWGENRVP